MALWKRFFVLLALCAANLLVTGGLPSQRPSVWCFYDFYVVSLKRFWNNSRNAGDVLTLKWRDYKKMDLAQRANDINVSGLFVNSAIPNQLISQPMCCSSRNVSDRVSAIGRNCVKQAKPITCILMILPGNCVMYLYTWCLIPPLWGKQNCVWLRLFIGHPHEFEIFPTYKYSSFTGLAIPALNRVIESLNQTENIWWPSVWWLLCTLM